MATKVEQNKTAQVQQSELTELSILFPDSRMTISGRDIVVRELRFAEQLRWQATLNDIARSFDEMNVHNINFFEEGLTVLGNHADKLLDIVAFCCDQPRDWIESLPASQGEELLITWWTVNNSFFVRRLLRQNIMKKISQTAVGNQQLGGGEFSQSLSEPVIQENP
ncbi:hypothetical protein DES39_0351 [Orbus hercynius]|uniref:Uncharacterized protein n=1 Tax=Orbus hercynius TaxID=593135 RepID=A0A495RIZ8_9GAMM|nr:DUF6631 family protein [Orbus hercynius]RKS87136.1 hypothetical protein DES39_0351 [Orbus hercynius]